MNYNKLEAYKKPLLKSRRASRIWSILFLAFAGFWGVLGLVFGEPKVILAMVIFLIPVIFFWLSIRADERVLAQLDRIQKNQTLNKTYEKRLYRPNFQYMTRSAGKYGGYLYGIYFLDENKNKYYYFLNAEMYYSRFGFGETHKQLQEKFYRELYVQCYENTTIIKTIENDSYFVSIR